MNKIRVISLHNKPIDEVTYILTKDEWKECLIIDPFNYENIDLWLQSNKKTCSYVFLTHEHYDHIAAVNQLREKFLAKSVASENCAKRVANARKNLSVYFDALLDMHGIPVTTRTEPYTVDKIDITFCHQYDMIFHGVVIHFVETPGHSPGSVCIEVEGCIFTGDSLLKDTPVITKFPEGNRIDYLNVTLPYLKEICENTVVYPGHGESFLMRDSKFINVTE